MMSLSSPTRNLNIVLEHSVPLGSDGPEALNALVPEAADKAAFTVWVKI